MGNSISISTFEELEKHDEAIMKNHYAYLHYFNRIKMLITEMFQWENLPDKITERFIEICLFEHGQLGFYKKSKKGLNNLIICARCNQNSNLDIYDNPLSYNCIANNGLNDTVSTDDIVILRNNKFSLPSQSLVFYHLSKIYTADRTIDVNMFQMRKPVLVKSTENGLMTKKNLIDQIDDYAPFIMVNDNLNEKDIEVLNMGVQNNLEELRAERKDRWNDLLNMFGINTANIDKKERMITDEVNSNNQLISFSVQQMLRERRLFCEEINKKFGTNITVELKQELNDSLNLEDKEDNENE